MTDNLITNQEITKNFPQIKYFLEWESGIKLPFHAIALGSEATNEATRKKEATGKCIASILLSIEKDIKANPTLNTLVWREKLGIFDDEYVKSGKTIKLSYGYVRFLLTYLETKKYYKAPARFSAPLIEND